MMTTLIDEIRSQRMIYGVLDILYICFQLVFKSLSSLPNHFRVITGLELYWMGDRPAGTKEAEHNAIWIFSRGTWSNPRDCSGYSKATRVPVLAANIFKETTSHYGICPNYPIVFSQPPVASIKIIFLEKAISLDLEKNPLNPITLFQSYFMLLYISVSVFSCFKAE
ncbi:hypothetical protein IGI04_035909 [Brassica rapa subsp. trilocularis]|uniref:Neprosin domain-containing protein n=1 Tax=Brassica rapa subsp. trilocularis TaxID=1813537 RepID=A0ABQ7LCV9_BRACM|nr:hypothetical protein IGI04_035909 [Brassica rapa subsp. trilocularis]